MSETTKSGDLLGAPVDIVVHRDPCLVVMQGCEPLTKSESGTLRAFHFMPCGPIGVLQTDDGRRIVFDAGFDLKNGNIEIVVPKDYPHPTLTSSAEEPKDDVREGSDT